MILLLNTSEPICKLTIIDGDQYKHYEWQSDRTLAKNLLSFLNEKIKDCGKTWTDISAIGIFEGPGSFTGLRIGITVMNTIADANGVPIVGGRGENWQEEAVAKLNRGIDEKIVLPFYGSEAHITISKK